MRGKEGIWPQISVELFSEAVASRRDLCSVCIPSDKACGTERSLWAFTKCCQETGLLMVVKCRQENTALKDCLVGYYSDPSFYEECKAEYLKQREEYRATGIKKKRQKFTPNV
uniref:COX assembly mitochondrial protein n=1 Tax=Taeniopygia guttata TaxID=59729 RepID=A0A674GS81_TAEGU